MFQPENSILKAEEEIDELWGEVQSPNTSDKKSKKPVLKIEETLCTESYETEWCTGNYDSSVNMSSLPKWKSPFKSKLIRMSHTNLKSPFNSKKAKSVNKRYKKRIKRSRPKVKNKTVI